MFSKLHLTKFLFLCFMFAVVSCSKSDDNPVTIPEAGYYTIVSATASAAFDFNGDGTASTDLMSELPELFSPNYPDLTIREGIELEKNYNRYANISYPHPYIALEEHPEDSYLDYSTSGASASYRIDLRTKKS